MRMYNRLMNLLTVFVLLCVLMTGAASAQETAMQEQISLFWMGDFPSADLSAVSLADESGFEAYVVEQLMQEKEKISVKSYHLRFEEFPSMFEAALYSHPELFFVGKEVLCLIDGSGYVTSFVPAYRYKGEERIRRTQAYKRSVDEIVRYAKHADTDLGRMMLVNTYLCTNYEYDQRLRIFSPDEFFEQKKGVCQAYMMAYCAVMNELGIPNTHAESEAMRHTWNMVQLGSQWYHVDVTWNDPTSDVPLGARYNHFLLSDDGLTRADHYGWTSSQMANSKKYDDAFWRESTAPIPVIEDEIYYVKSLEQGGESVLKYNIETEKTHHLFDIDSRASIAATGKHIFYIAKDGKSVHAVHHDGEECQIEYVLKESGKKIWRMNLEGLHLNLFVAGSEFGSGEVVKAHIYDSMKMSFDHPRVKLDYGDVLKLVPRYDPQPKPECEPVLTYESSNELIASVDEQGVVTGHMPGRAVITAHYGAVLSAQCSVLVRSDKTLVFPEGVTVIGEEAFAGAEMEQVLLADGVLNIGAGAFKGCEQLLYVNLPDSIETIAQDAFDGCAQVTLVGGADSKTEKFAQAAGLQYAIYDQDDHGADLGDYYDEDAGDNWETDEF